MKQWLSLITPSKYGMFFYVVGVVMVILLLSFPNVLERTGVGEYLSLIKEGEVQSEIYTDYQVVSQQINSSAFAADSSVFIFWATIGLLAYAGVLALKHVFDEARELVEASGYAKWGRRELWMGAAEKLLIRLVAISLLFAWTLFVLRILLPLAVANIGLVTSTSVLSMVAGVVLVSVIALPVFHITTILLRMLLLRTRIFLNSSLLQGGH